ncbi:29207_t:CDS:1 [Racocetra persica]|uniref:29207_t:CDS:1 n=1 Tax=Racocetra persica TaxID=160502 RepID=A0ACA9SGV3_9GLOM|nr:29207_t:CDS:1 [Racocetra persica]
MKPHTSTSINSQNHTLIPTNSWTKPTQTKPNTCISTNSQRL